MISSIPLRVLIRSSRWVDVGDRIGSGKWEKRPDCGQFVSETVSGAFGREQIIAARLGGTAVDDSEFQVIRPPKGGPGRVHITVDELILHKY